MNDLFSLNLRLEDMYQQTNPEIKRTAYPLGKVIHAMPFIPADASISSNSEDTTFSDSDLIPMPLSVSEELLFSTPTLTPMTPPQVFIQSSSSDLCNYTIETKHMPHRSVTNIKHQDAPAYTSHQSVSSSSQQWSLYSTSSHDNRFSYHQFTNGVPAENYHHHRSDHLPSKPAYAQREWSVSYTSATTRPSKQGQQTKYKNAYRHTKKNLSRTSAQHHKSRRNQKPKQHQSPKNFTKPHQVRYAIMCVNALCKAKNVPLSSMIISSKVLKVSIRSIAQLETIEETMKELIDKETNEVEMVSLPSVENVTKKKRAFLLFMKMKDNQNVEEVVEFFTKKGFKVKIESTKPAQV